MPETDIARILILAQTSPNFSKKYTETVCTAGLRLMPDSSYRWVRLYPIMKRQMDASQEYHKFQWIECRLDNPDRNSDKRPESYKVFMDTITPGDCIDIKTKGEAKGVVRRSFLLEQAKIPVFTNKQRILDAAAANEFSLCLFKPTRIVKILAEPQSTQFTPEEEEIIRNAREQHYLLDHYDSSKLFFKKLPFRFKCEFEDDEAASSSLSILDWEISSRMRHDLKSEPTTAAAADATIRHYRELCEKWEPYFVLGTRHHQHNMLLASPTSGVNPWSIISVIFLPKPEALTQGRFNF